MPKASVNEEQMNQDKDPPVLCKSIRYYFREYCNCSSIHGFRYFGEKRTYFERLWWFIVFSSVVAICAYLIREVYQKWERSPVIVSFATSETPIYTIPFPAVTICPESKNRQSKYNHTDILVKLSSTPSIPLNETESRNALYMSLICDVNSFRTINTAGTTTFSNDFFDFLNESRRENFLADCTWMGEPVNCDDIFVPIITDEGICQTFNMLDREDLFRENIVQYSTFLQNPEKSNLTWNLDDGYSEDDKLETYPRRALFAGVRNALGVSLLAQRDDIDHTCKDSLQGFRVILHTPMRIPRPSNQYFRVPLNEVVLGSIQPVMITTSDTVKVYDAKRRECYFPSERSLAFLRIYTQQNCHLECLTNFTLSLCNCVNFYMPITCYTKNLFSSKTADFIETNVEYLISRTVTRVFRKLVYSSVKWHLSKFSPNECGGEKGTQICGAAKKTCMNLAEKWLQTKGLVTKLDELRKSSKNETDGDDDDDYIQVPKCDCMPICTDLSYDVETSQADWNWQEKWRAIYHKMPFGENTSMSKLTLYFKTSQFVTSKRHELYGPTDFLANFGGLLGLFTGFSVLSLMEIIYFLTVRLCCNVRLFGSWYGPEQN